ncbi:DegT/DnrJ/EryC1/StrS family aminotransferase [Halosolutus amylolyticus]|uniref:DegT/DnrJ/EryC1/StrS family aminotransferase n=1 Tax=Halosolutus amylolyticus TaxID=2932267 RepID=A0ABD5PMH9_9EURY|nr:DegT/DnrJ/EryC1/StrS family aminotransferase [Halosolutus amylolyticus]
MIRNSPPLFEGATIDRSPAGIEGMLDRHAREATFYGSGKVALRDGLAALVESGDTVLVPAYLPDAVVEPLHDLGLVSRYYAVEETLAPDLADLESRIDHRTAAVVSVNYFGFPMPGLGEFRALVEEYDCYHVDDNAHGPISVDDGTLLGTRGHLGVTSLWKLLPIPDGAVLYCNDDDVAEVYTPSHCAGVRDRLTAADVRYVLTSLVSEVLDRDGRFREVIDAIVPDRVRPSVPGPRERYEAGKAPMSKLSACVIADADLQAIRRARRENYRAWHRVLDPYDDVDPLYESLPPGICPQVYPVRASDPGRFRETLDRCGVSNPKTWPRLSPPVVGDPQYETAQRLAREVVVLPVHQGLDPTTIEAVGKRLPES